MLLNTKYHKERNEKGNFTIKVGSKVPKDSVNLAFYYNKGANSNEHVLASAVPKNLIDHMEITKFKRKDNLTFEDESVFEKTMPYNDNEGYTGILNLHQIDWIKHIETETKFVSISRAYDNLTEQNVPETIQYQEGRLKGTLYLKQAKYIPTKYGQKIVQVKESKSFLKTYQVDNLGEPSFNFPGTYTVNEQGYRGEIPKVNGSERFLPIEHDSKVVPVTINETIAGNIGNVPSSKPYNYNGKTYNIPLTSKTTSMAEVRHYGVCRYWGYGSTGLYGTGDRKYRATKDGGKGYFRDNKAPAQLMSRYGHRVEKLMEFKNCVINSAYTSYRDRAVSEFYIDEDVRKVNGNPYSGKYSYNYNYETCYHPNGITPDLVEGSEWTYDLDKAAQYGAPNNLKDGGCVWASQYASRTTEWPPKGYESDPIHNGNSHMWLVTDSQVINGSQRLSSGTINVEGVNISVSDLLKINRREKIISSALIKRSFVFTNVTKCTRELAYPGVQQFSKMTVQFYKGNIKRTNIVYSGNIIVDGGRSYSGKCDYKGTLTKTTDEFKEVPIEWRCEAIYEGVISYSYPLYDGLATYKGIVVKRNAVGNLNPEGEKEFIMYPNKDGILHLDLDDTKSKDLEGDNFLITNVFYDDEPLYYSHKLNLFISDHKGPDELGFYTGNTIKLIDENNKELDSKKYKYKIKLVETKFKGSYVGYVFTSFKTPNNKNIYCIYNGFTTLSHSNNLGSSEFKSSEKEKIFVQPHFQVNEHFNVLNIGNNLLTNIKVNDYIVTKDLRRKTAICYVVKTTDNHYVSKPIYANIVNKKFAFETEKNQFIKNNHIISPKENGVYLTATDILVRDLEISSDQLKDKQIIVELENTEISLINHKKVYVYTDQDGSGLILGETVEDTGFYNEETNEYDLKQLFNTKHTINNNYIHCAFSVYFKDVRPIEVISPIENKALENWYPRVKFGHFTQSLEQYNARTKVTYSIPEFSRQDFNSYDGKPYKSVKDEKAIIIDSTTLKVRHTPIYVKRDEYHCVNNLFAYKVNILGQSIPLEIISWSYEEGIINIKDEIGENDNVYVNYTYEEETYIYRGCNMKGIFADIDLNPNKYHTFLDTSQVPYVRKKTYDLFNRIVYFFLRPKLVEDLELGTVFVDNEEVLYHKYDYAIPDDEYDLLVGKVYVRHNSSLKSTEIIDTRTRGGGLLVEIEESLRKELEPESDYYFDIGYYDGEMYTENSVVLIRLDNRLLKEYGGSFTQSQIEKAIEKWIAFGTYYIVEYVKVLTDNEIPQNNLTIESL